MSNILKKVVISIFFTLQLSSVFACSQEKLDQSLNTILAIQQQILSEQYNRAFLENKKHEVFSQENKISNCIQKNLETIQNFENIHKNIQMIHADNEQITLYQASIENIKSNNRYCEKILQTSQSVINDIQAKIKQAQILDQASRPHYELNTLISNYQSTAPKIVFKSMAATFPAATLLYRTEPMFVYGLICFAVLSFGLGLMIFRWLKKIHQKMMNLNTMLFLSYTKYMIPWYLFIIPFEIYLSYKTQHFLMTPNALLILDFFYRAMNVYFLTLFAFCFFIDNESLKTSAIKLFNQFIMFIFTIGMIQMCYIIFLEKTTFIQLFYILIFLPVFIIGLNYYMYRCAKLPHLAFNRRQHLIYGATCLSFGLSYSLIRIMTIYMGYLSFTITQLILVILVIFYYIQFIKFQFKHSANQKINAFIAGIKHKLFGNDFNQAYEATILQIVMNILITFYTLSLVFNILNIPDIYKYELVQFSSLKIQLGNLEIAINQVVTACLFFSIIMMIENILSHHFLTKKIDIISSNIYITKKNIIHYLFMILAIIASMIILDISSAQITLVIGGIGLGAGFGLQFVIENLISGLLIILNKEIYVGEYIQITNEGGDTIVQGKVLHIYAMCTIIEMDNELIYVPNSKIYRNTIRKKNNSEHQIRTGKKSTRILHHKK